MTSRDRTVGEHGFALQGESRVWANSQVVRPVAASSVSGRELTSYCLLGSRRETKRNKHELGN